MMTEYRIPSNELIKTLSVWKELDKRYKETAKYDTNEEKVLRNYELLSVRIKRLNQ